MSKNQQSAHKKISIKSVQKDIDIDIATDMDTHIYPYNQIWITVPKRIHKKYNDYRARRWNRNIHLSLYTLLFFWTWHYVSVLWIQNALNELTKEICKTQNNFLTIFMIIVMVESIYANSQELYMLIHFYICVEERLHFI